MIDWVINSETEYQKNTMIKDLDMDKVYIVRLDP